MTVKDKAQKAVVDEYFEKDLLKCCAVLSTGFGKSKVAIDIIKRLDPPKVLILVDSVILRDFNWREEFITWGEVELFNSKIELVTYQAAYKWKKEDKDLSDYFIVADECDFAANTDELSKFFYEYAEVRTLGLTGFITNDKLEWFSEHLPIFTQLSAADAQNLKILNNLHFVFVQYDLSLKKDIPVNYKKNGEAKVFFNSESSSYDYLNKKVMILSTDFSKVETAFRMGQLTILEKEAQQKSLQYKSDRAVAERNNVLLLSKTSVEMCKKLIQHDAVKNPNGKTIVFSKRTEQSIKICTEDFCYNGSIPKKKAEENFKRFLSGESKLLGVVDKVNRGANIDNLYTAILETFFGGDTKAVQRFGRLMRLKPNEIATVYVLLPYYMRREKNNTYTIQETQQVKWARNMLRSTKIKSSVVWNYCVVKPKTND